MCVILNETESARCLVESVQPHNQPLDLTALGKEFMNLFLRSVEGT